MQYWTMIALSLVIPATTLLNDGSNIDVPMNAALVSLGLLTFAALALFDLYPWQDLGQLACGTWLMGSSLMLSYSTGGLRYVHFGLGAMPVLLALYNLWRDRIGGKLPLVP